MAATGVELPTLELHFKPATLWESAGQGWLVGLVVGVIGAAIAVQLVNPDGWSEVPGALLVLGGGLAALLVVAATRRRGRRKEAAPARAYATHLELPEAAGSARARRVEYRDVLSVNVVGYGPGATLLLGTRDRLLSYPQHSFVEPEGIGRLSAEIRRQIERQPGGARLIAAMNLRDAIGQAAWAARPVVTVVVLLSLGVGAFLTSRADGQSPFPLLAYGANAPLLVSEGQWFRLFSANFLHANLLHLYMNGLGVLTLGALLERLLGPWRFTLIYLASALGGSLASAWAARAAYSVGASTAVFGLFGALAALEWRFRTELPAGFRQTRRWWQVMLGVNAALSLLLPMIDGFAHGGGFLAGGVATLVLCAHPDAIRRARPAPWSIRVASVLAAGTFAIALGAAFAHARTDSGLDQVKLEQAIVDSPASDATMLNALAWHHAVSQAPSRAELELADRAVTSATALEPDDLAILDTLATVQYRRGYFDRAIELERRVLAARDEDFTFTQVARFLQARRARRGALTIGTDESADQISLELAPADLGAAARAELVIRASAALPRGAEVWALAMAHGSLVGAVVLHIGPTSGGELRAVPKGNAMELGREELTLDVALLDGTSCQRCEPGTVQAEYRPMHPEAIALPGGSDASNR